MNRGGRTVGVPGILRDHPTGQVGGLRPPPAAAGCVGRDLVRLGADRSFTDHDRVRVGGHRELVGDRPVRPDRPTHRLAVNRQAVAQPGRRRPGPPPTGRRPARTSGTGWALRYRAIRYRPACIGQVLAVQRLEHPLDRVRVRRHPHPGRGAAGTHRGQQVLRRGRHPRGDVDHLDLSGRAPPPCTTPGSTPGCAAPPADPADPAPRRNTPADRPDPPAPTWPRRPPARRPPPPRGRPVLSEGAVGLSPAGAGRRDGGDDRLDGQRSLRAGSVI